MRPHYCKPGYIVSNQLIGQVVPLTQTVPIYVQPNVLIMISDKAEHDLQHANYSPITPRLYQLLWSHRTSHQFEHLYSHNSQRGVDPHSTGYALLQQVNHRKPLSVRPPSSLV